MVVASSNRSGVSPQLRVPTADDASRGGGLYRLILRQRRVAVPRGGGSAGARARTALPVPARSLIAESAWRSRLR